MALRQVVSLAVEMMVRHRLMTTLEEQNKMHLEVKPSIFNQTLSPLFRS